MSPISTLSAQLGTPGQSRPQDHGGRHGAPRARPLILVVEDEHLTALDLKRSVRRFGYDAVEQSAATAEDALALAKAHGPDLILMDVRLKGGPDGVDAARAILEEVDEIPIIYLTAFSNEDTVNRVRSINPAGFIFKPIDFRRLEREIALALTHWRRQ